MEDETKNQETTETSVNENAEQLQVVEEKAVETPAEVKVEETQGEVTIEPVQELAEEVEINEPGIIQGSLKNDLPELRQGDMVKVYQKIKEVKDNKVKERVQVFEGQILAMKHGRGITGTITVRKVLDGIGVEKIFPIHSPLIQKIEVLKQTKTRRAKLYYLRTAKGRKAKLKATTHKKEETEIDESEAVE
jgi:large subunit ribosomal protein L19